MEYVKLISFENHPVTFGVSNFILNWGQSISISGSAFPLATRTIASWGDEDITSDSDPNCIDDWYINTDDSWKSHGNLIGIVAYESEGKVVAIGDQDTLWNFWLPGEVKKLIGNVFSFFVFPYLVTRIASGLSY